MKDVINSFSDWMKEKTSSPLYFTYICFLVIWNWQFFYALFFENSSLLNVSHLQYAISFQKNFFISLPIPSTFNDLLSWTLKFLFEFFPPILFTYISIIYLPKISAWAHEIYLKNFFERQLAYDNASLEYETQKTKNLKRVGVQKIEQVKEKEKIARVLSDEEKWEIDYIEFKKHSLYSRFREALTAVYRNNGSTRIFSNGGYVPTVSPNILAMADVKGLINIIGDKRDKIELTDKGKYFADKYLETNVIG
jgi:predicted transcriptional regulator